MCGCSPVCKSFFDPHRARRIVRTCARSLCDASWSAGRYGALGSESRSAPRTHRSAVGIWFSRSRPWDRLPHKWSKKSLPSASGETPSANSVPGSNSGVDDQLLLVFIPLSGLDACMNGASCYVSEYMGAQTTHSTLSGLPRTSLETNPYLQDRPMREWNNHTICPGSSNEILQGSGNSSSVNVRAHVPTKSYRTPSRRCGEFGEIDSGLDYDQVLLELHSAITGEVNPSASRFFRTIRETVSCSFSDGMFELHPYLVRNIFTDFGFDLRP